MSEFIREAPPAEVAEPRSIPTIIGELHTPRVSPVTLYDLAAEQAKYPFLAELPTAVPNLSDTTYHGIKAWSKSMISKLVKSPAHLKYALTHPQASTEAMMIGRAFHTAILENHKFDEQYALKPDVKLNTNIGKAEYAAWIKADPSRLDKLHLKLDDFRTITGCRESIMAHPECRKYVEMPGEVELSSFWLDRETGLFMKGRQDKVVVLDGRLVIIDLKTAKDASPKGFASAIYDRQYHVQAGLYCDAISECFNTNCTRFIFLAVEKEPPYVCAAYELEPEAIAAGRNTYVSYLSRLRDCVEADSWPGYSDDLAAITLPKYALPNGY